MNAGFHYLPGGNDDPNPALPCSAFLDIAPSKGITSPETLCRLYFKGKPQPAVIAQQASAWHQQGARVQLANEPNLPGEGFGGGPGDYAAWFFSVKVKVPGVRCYWAGMSPSGNWRDWYAGAEKADGIAAHAYGTFAQMREVVEFLIPLGKPIWIAECNFGAGQVVDRDLWAVDHLAPFLDWCSTVPLVEAVTYFAWTWPTPDTPLATPVDAKRTRIETVIREWKEPTVATIKGVDVSNWQRYPDFARVKAAGYEFAFIKVSEDDYGDADFYDPYAAGNWANAQAAGLVRGVYHFVRPSKSSPSESVTVLQRAIDKIGGLAPGDLVAIDIEDEKVLGSQHVWVAEMLDLTERVLGFTPLKYSGDWYTTTRDLEHQDLAKYPTWWASYQASEPAPETGWGPIRIWQFSAHAQVPGVVGDCDVNEFDGTAAELRALGKPAPAGVDWETPVLAPIYQGASAVPGMPDATNVDIGDAEAIIQIMDQIKARHPVA